MVSKVLKRFFEWSATRALTVILISVSLGAVGYTNAWAQMGQEPQVKRLAGHIPTIDNLPTAQDSSSKEPDLLQRKRAMDIRYFSDYYHQNGNLLHHVSAKYRRDWNRFSLELRGMWADRQGFRGQNYGAGLYPQLTNSTYLELEGTYSVDSIFPQWSASGALVQGIGSWLELTGGYRYVQFSAVNIELYTGAIGLYPGNWELKAWAYYTDQLEHYDYSGSARIRYLGTNKDSYIGVQAGYGPIAEGLNFARDRIRTEQMYGALIWSIHLNPSWDLVGRASYHQERFTPANVLRERLRGELGFVIKF